VYAGKLTATVSVCLIKRKSPCSSLKGQTMSSLVPRLDPRPAGGLRNRAALTDSYAARRYTTLMRNMSEITKVYSSWERHPSQEKLIDVGHTPAFVIRIDRDRTQWRLRRCACPQFYDIPSSSSKSSIKSFYIPRKLGAECDSSYGSRPIALLQSSIPPTPDMLLLSSRDTR